MTRDDSYLIGNQFAKGHKPNRTSFRKGMEPWNKGKKGIHLSPKSQFKKGCKSNRIMPIGSITIRHFGRDNRDRAFIKIADPSKWRELARWTWEQEFGPLKSGDVVHHINGNSLDDRLDNLIAIPRTDHPIFHSRWGLKPFSEKQLAYYKARYR